MFFYMQQKQKSFYYMDNKDQVKSQFYTCYDNSHDVQSYGGLEWTEILQDFNHVWVLMNKPFVKSVKFSLVLQRCPHF